MQDVELEVRARRHAALGDTARLAIVDELGLSDRSPGELQHLLGISSNLLAHHLDVLESAGLVVRSRSSGDGRRRYVQLCRSAAVAASPPRQRHGDALFVCTHNSARSQLAAALWREITGTDAWSAGTHPASEVHPGAIAAARRAGVDLSGAVPRRLDEVVVPDLVVTVCDRAHEEAAEPDRSVAWLHWSVPDPVDDGGRAAFDASVVELRDRIGWITGSRVA